MPHVIKPRSTCNDMTVENTEDTPLWEILVPTVGNDGTPFTVRHHRNWDAHVQAIAGGMTLVPPVRGTWIDKQPESGPVEYTERMIPVRLMCTREQIEQICKETARHYHQIAVLATLVSTETVLVANPHARPPAG